MLNVAIISSHGFESFYKFSWWQTLKIVGSHGGLYIHSKVYGENVRSQ